MERWTKEMSQGTMHSFCMAAYPSPWKLCVYVCVCALVANSELEDVCVCVCYE